MAIYFEAPNFATHSWEHVRAWKEERGEVGRKTKEKQTRNNLKKGARAVDQGSLRDDSGRSFGIGRNTGILSNGSS